VSQTAIPILSMTCADQGPIIAAAHAAEAEGVKIVPYADPDQIQIRSDLWCHPEVLLCPPRPGQEALLGKLSGLRASLGLCYSWAGLLCYNALSRKQLAVAAVTSYPFVFDPVAGESVCSLTCLTIKQAPVQVRRPNLITHTTSYPLCLTQWQGTARAWQMCENTLCSSGLFDLPSHGFKTPHADSVQHVVRSCCCCSCAS
jgi:hypothetical protein